MIDPKPVDLLIINGCIITMNDHEDVIVDGAVAIDKGLIIDIGDSSRLVKKYKPNQLLDAESKLVVPGLINTHTHGGDIVYRGLIEDLQLEEWLNRLMKVESNFVNYKSVYWGAMLAYIEMVKGGITTAIDMFWQPEALVDAANTLGFRLITGPVFFNGEDSSDKSTSEQIAKAREFIQYTSSYPLISFCLQPHSVYTVSPGLLLRVGELASELNCLLVTHASETKREVENCIKEYNLTPIQHLNNLGLLSDKTVLAHCVHCQEEDFKLLKKQGAIVSHCPVSNLKLASGIADIYTMLESGIKVTLGTDGPVSGNDLNPWLAMRFAAVLQKTIQETTSILDSKQVFSLMTSKAAESLQLSDKIGSLEVNKQADLLIVDNDQVHSIPYYDPYTTLIYSIGREDVRTVIINGCVIVHEGKLLTFDEREAKDNVKRIGRTIQQYVAEKA